MKFTKEDLKDSAACANFMQAFKMLLWENERRCACKLFPISEDDLDTIALELWATYGKELEIADARWKRAEKHHKDFHESEALSCTGFSKQTDLSYCNDCSHQLGVICVCSCHE